MLDMKKSLLIFVLFISNLLVSQTTSDVNGINWFTDNLSVGSFNNGEPIFNAKTDVEWRDACLKKKPAYFEIITSLGKKEKIYNYYVLIDKRGILPKGKRYPKGSEFIGMNDFFISNTDKIKEMNFVWGEMIYINSCDEITREKANNFWYLDVENMPIEAVLEMNTGPCMSLSICPNQEKSFPLCDGNFNGFESLAAIGMAQLGNGMFIRLVKE